MDKMRFAVVIVTYNRLKLLKECISNVLEQTIPFDNIIIVNNCSTDGTDSYLEQLKRENINNDNINIINMDENIGGSGGFYYGLKKSVELNNDWTLLIDDDAIISTDYNELISTFINENSSGKFSAVSGTVCVGKEIDTNHRSNSISNFRLKVSHIDKKEYDKEFFDYDFTSFCGVYISNRVIGEIGYPCKEYFIWHDDTEYSIRLRKSGKIRNINAAKLDHRVNFNTKGVDNQLNWKTYYGIRNMTDLTKRHYSVMGQIYTYFLHSLSLYKFKFKIHKSDVDKKNIQLYKDALYDGKNSILGKNKKYLP